jgi:ribonuclease VapC
VRVLDSWALIAFFEDEPAAAAVEEILNQAVLSGDPLYLSVMNWAEIYYNTMREISREHAEARVHEIETLPIEIVTAGDDLKLARAAAQLKARFKISLADAFAAALAREKKAELITGDGEFKALEKEIRIAWLPNS